MFIATFNNISVISWRSVLLVEESGVPEENHQPVTSHWQTLSHNVVSSTPRLSGVQLTTLVVMGTDCTGSCKANYHTIMTMTAPDPDKTTSTIFKVTDNFKISEISIWDINFFVLYKLLFAGQKSLSWFLRLRYNSG